MAEMKQEQNEALFSALSDFFKGGEVKIYEAGLEENAPARIQDRYFFQALPREQTSYLSNSAEATAAGNYTLSVGKPAEASALDTESHSFLSEVENRFKNVRPDATLIIIDPDVIRGRYAMDDTRDRSLDKQLLMYLQDKIEERQAENDIDVEPGDAGIFKNAAFDGNSPFSMALKTGVKDGDHMGERQVALVVASNPDMPMHTLFTRVPGAVERIKQLGFTSDQARRLVLYHEIGHALDRNVTPDPLKGTKIEQLLRRHQTECLADAHAMLQVARDFGTTAPCRLMSDIRMDNTITALDSYFPFDQKTKSGNPVDNFENLEKSIRRQALQDTFAPQNEGKADTKAPQSPVAQPAAPAQPQKKDGLFTKLEKQSKLFERLSGLGSSLAYHTTDVADAAIAFAEKGLKDGSLIKMTDREVLDTAQKIVDRYSLSAERIEQICAASMFGTLTPDVVHMCRRAKQAQANMGVDPETLNKKYAKRKKETDAYIQKMIQARKGIHTPRTNAPEPKNSEKTAMDAWRKDMLKRIQKDGGDRQALLNVVAQEKDVLRQFRHPLDMKKIETLNAEFLGYSQDTALKASARASIAGMITEQTKGVKVPETGDALIGAYLLAEMECLAAGQETAAKTEARVNKMLFGSHLTEAVEAEGKSFENVVKAEAKAQNYAFALRADKEAWETVKQIPELSKTVIQQASHKHPEWMDNMSINIMNPAAWRAEETALTLTFAKKELAEAVMKEPKLAEKLGKTASAAMQEVVRAAYSAAPGKVQEAVTRRTKEKKIYGLAAGLKESGR